MASSAPPPILPLVEALPPGPLTAGGTLPVHLLTPFKYEETKGKIDATKQHLEGTNSTVAIQSKPTRKKTIEQVKIANQKEQQTDTMPKQDNAISKSEEIQDADSIGTKAGDQEPEFVLIGLTWEKMHK